MVDPDYMNSMVDPDYLNTTLSTFSTLNENRLYTSQNGLDGANWIFDTASALVGDRLGGDVSIRFFEHSWAQPSVILRIEGTDATEKEMVILGAHQDSTSNSPGANDDGSGSITLIQSLKIFMEAGFEPQRPVELHWCQCFSERGVAVLHTIIIFSFYQCLLMCV